MSKFRNELIQIAAQALKSGDYQTAGNIGETAIAENPNDIAALQLLGAVHMGLGNYGSAVTLARMALEIAQASGQTHSEHWYNLGSCLHRTYNRAPALQALLKAVEMAPEDAECWQALSAHYMTYGDPVKAEECARKALELSPESPMAHSELGLALLSQDRWAEAWPHTEYRKKLSKKWGRPDYPIEQWHGEKVETLIIHAEQGLGDELFHCSLVPRLYDLADRIVIESNPRLVSLLRRSLGCEVYGSMQECFENGVFSQEVMNDIDMVEAALAERKPSPIMFPRMSAAKLSIVAMGSLPAILGATRENCADNAYLIADPIRAIYWRARLEALANGRPIVGVAWLGGTYENHKTLRNPPREMFERLNPERYCLVSVQYTQNAASQAARMGMHHFQQAINDLDEQAAIIRALDCLVSVAQTAMHIGGALGTKTLALIGQFPKWDCGQSGPSVPYWKSVKAIRQEGDDWAPVFDKLLIELGEESKSVTEKAMRFGPVTGAVPDLTQLNIGGNDAPSPDIRGTRSAAE